MTTYLVTDVDGVFTDGKFTYSRWGKSSKVFGPHDADGIKILRAGGIKIFAITGDRRGFAISRKRLSDMKIQLFYKSEKDRYDWVKNHFDLSNLIFVGDGAFDVPLLLKSALSFAPNTATHPAKDAARMVTSVAGGDGVFLEIAMWMILYFFSPEELARIKSKLKISEEHFDLLCDTYRNLFLANGALKNV